MKRCRWTLIVALRAARAIIGGRAAAPSVTIMRVIPVLDLKGGVAVHAVRGQRQAYAPVQSVLAPSADPVVLARAFADRLGARACYVADLDAITGTGDHIPVIGELARLGLEVWLDSGTATAADAERAHRAGAARVIVGTETLRDPGELGAMARALGAPAPLVVSVDLRGGRLLGGSPDVSALAPGAIASIAVDAGIETFIALDLAQVGSGEGPRLEAARALRRGSPRAQVLIGGGVRDHADLAALAAEGFAGALIATALHRGVITSLQVGEHV